MSLATSNVGHGDGEKRGKYFELGWPTARLLIATDCSRKELTSGTGGKRIWALGPKPRNSIAEDANGRPADRQ